MNKIKVLMVIDNGLSIGGVQEIIMALVEELNERVDFDIIVTADSPQYYDEEFKKYGSIYCVKRIKNFRSFKGIYHFIMDDYHIYKKVIDILKTKKYDAIYCANLFSAAPFLKAAGRSGVPVRIVHSMVAASSHILWYSKLLYSKKRCVINKYATLKLSISKQSGNFLYGKNNDSLVVKNPIRGFSDFFDLEYFPDVNHHIRMLHLGYIGARKNAQFSIEVLEKLIVTNPQFQLIIAGHGDQNYIEELQNKINVLGLKKYISLIPNTVDIKEMFKNCELVILPSKNEGIPLILLEAQAAGIPCFVSNLVEKEVNRGLCTFISIDNGAEEWSNTILNYLEVEGMLRKRVDMSDWENDFICDMYYKWFLGNK